jgi:hypothetical protein
MHPFLSEAGPGSRNRRASRVDAVVIATQAIMHHSLGRTRAACVQRCLPRKAQCQEPLQLADKLANMLMAGHLEPLAIGKMCQTASRLEGLPIVHPIISTQLIVKDCNECRLPILGTLDFA